MWLFAAASASLLILMGISKLDDDESCCCCASNNCCFKRCTSRRSSSSLDNDDDDMLLLLFSQPLLIAFDEYEELFGHHGHTTARIMEEWKVEVGASSRRRRHHDAVPANFHVSRLVTCDGQTLHCGGIVSECATDRHTIAAESLANVRRTDTVKRHPAIFDRAQNLMLTTNRRQPISSATLLQRISYYRTSVRKDLPVTFYLCLSVVIFRL